MKSYAGIGSRETPIDIQNIMTSIAKQLANYDYILHSGGAEGADSAFEKGATYKKIYLPWDNFNNKKVDNKQYFIPAFNRDFVDDYHPNTNRLSSAGYKLMSRNTYQVLGDDLESPVDLLICWTSDGKFSGGTGQAMRIAYDHNIPIYNLKLAIDLEKLVEKYKLTLA